MEVYMLHEHGIRPTRATNIVMQNFIFYQVALVLFGICAVIYNICTKALTCSPFLRGLIIVGFLINAGVALFLFFVAASKKFTRMVVLSILKIGKKLHLVKNLEKQQALWEERLDDFHRYTSELKENKTLFIFGVFANFISLFCFYAIPLFILYSLHDFTSLHLFETLTASAYVLIMGAFCSDPGSIWWN